MLLLRRSGTSFVLLLAFALAACSGGKTTSERIEGATMGTRYHISWMADASTPDPALVQLGVDDLLAQFEQAMSTYRDDSELSRFNREPEGKWVHVSMDLLTLLLMARQVSANSDYAYDVTVGPVVDLWGFGPEVRQGIPDDAAISAALKRVDERQLEMDMARVRARRLGPVSVDLSSIAKGYAVDRVSDWLLQQGISAHLVEIGGELKALGQKHDGEAWRVGIEDPGSTPGTVLDILQLNNVAVATSGSYRNYFEVDGTRYSHTIDPRTGKPVRHELVSVTVVHSSAATADAWATALTVLGPERALAIANEQQLAAYLISRGQGELTVAKSAAMAAHLQ